MEEPKRCSFTMKALARARSDLVTNGRMPCNRDVVWYIEKVGYACHFHMERYLEEKMPDPSHIHRLSDDDKDFACHTEPGYGTTDHNAQFVREHKAKQASGSGR